MAGVIVRAQGLYGTRKQARQAVARQCIEFFERQRLDHQVVDPTLKAEKQLRKEEERDEEPTVGPADTFEVLDNRLLPLTVNLIDSPGHIEFNAEVTAALRVSDGALVVVDVVEGMVVQTKEVLVQALREGVKPVLMLNKVDRLFVDKQYSAERVFDEMEKVVNDINDFIAAHQLEHFSDQRVSFLDGSVCFGSGYFGWSCAIDTLVNKDLSADERRAVRKYLSKRDNFVKQVIKPILRMHRVCGVLPMKKELRNVDRVALVNELLAEKIPNWSGKRLLGSKDDASTIEPRQLLKKAMMAWLPAADAIVDMVAAHVPSPIIAQRKRAELLYSGDVEDASGEGIKKCDPAGRTIVYISKMAPSSQSSKRLVAYGRVFSGTIRAGDTLRAIRTDGLERQVKISQIKICGIGGKTQKVESAVAGELVAIEGVDDALSKAGTLTSSADGMAIRHMNFAVAPVVLHSVSPKDKRNLTKMISEFHQVVNTDSSALFYKDAETGCHILAGTGDLHIEVLVSAFVERSGIEIELSEPIIAYRETVQAESSEIALAKSDNKHNRVFVKASPLSDDLVEALSSGDLAYTDSKALGKALVKDFGWTSAEASRILAIGPEPLSSTAGGNDQPTCLLVDGTFGLQMPDDFRANLVAAFQQVTREGGVLVHAPLRGVRFDLVDAKFHQDAVHRRPNAIVPAAARAMRGALVLAQPTLMEPMYKVDVTGGSQTLNGAYAVLGQRGGMIVDTSSTGTTDAIEAALPVRRAFGLVGALRLATQGHAHCSCLYQGMRLVPPVELDGIVTQARLRKKLPEKVPTVEAFVDKLK